MASEVVELMPILTVAASLGVSWGVFKVKGAVTSKRLDELEAEGDALVAELHRHKEDTTDRLARIETKLDILLGTRN